MSPLKKRWIACAIILPGALVALLLARLLSDSSSPGRLQLPLGNGTPQISLGERHGLILASDGSLWAWGSDLLGWPVLGLGSGPLKSTVLRRIDSGNDWVAISAGMTHSLALKSDGTLWTWGESVVAQRTPLTPIPSPVPAAPGNDWKQAVAGGIHSVALKRDGTLWGWGNNWAGCVGIPLTNGSATPLQIGTATNWTRVWAGILETVAMQSDGSLWYWGENPNPIYAQQTGQIFSPTRVGSETNWVDIGFGVNTVLGIKSDGTLWAWGRQAHVYTGLSNTSSNAIPVRVGTDSDWEHISPTTGWWCVGLTKKDGSLWLLDASDGEPNGPRAPFKPTKFRKLEFPGDHVAYAGGAVHAAGAGIHGPIAVVLNRDGEVWTSGMILGDPSTATMRAQTIAVQIANRLHWRIPPPDAPPVYRQQPWQLRNIDSEQP